eukprot:1755343-Rhodomonas_salina.1
MHGARPQVRARVRRREVPVGQRPPRAGVDGAADHRARQDAREGEAAGGRQAVRDGHGHPLVGARGFRRAVQPGRDGEEPAQELERLALCARGLHEERRQGGPMLVCAPKPSVCVCSAMKFAALLRC